jgi:U3 small nucleolar RNA-associated protein 19
MEFYRRPSERLFFLYIPERKMSTREGKSKKRKIEANGNGSVSASKKLVAEKATTEKLSTQKITELETQILASPVHYNELPKLIAAVKKVKKRREVGLKAAVSLCRIFCHFISQSQLLVAAAGDKKQAIVRKWLAERYNEYLDTLFELLASSELDIAAKVNY